MTPLKIISVGLSLGLLLVGGATFTPYSALAGEKNPAASMAAPVPEGSEQKTNGSGKLQARQRAVIPAQGDDILLLQARTIFGQMPDRMPGSENDTPVRIKLGRMLYFEPNMSINRTQSCNDCHILDESHGGVDNLPTSLGAKGEFGPRNSPTVLNAGFQISQFWDGRAADLAEQAKAPILNPKEMGMPDPDLAVERVRSLKKYQELFPEAFPGQKNPITYDNIAEAIAAFERTLISRSRFDRFLAGAPDALTSEEKKGLELFMNEGCIRCHSGPLLGGVLYQKLGIYHPYSTDDLGRYEQTKDEDDKYVFKVPMLRSVTLTAPYFHDGLVATLAEAIDAMAWHQLDVTLQRDQIDRIMRFLTAVADEKRISAPPPPESDQKTWWAPPEPTAIPKGDQGDLIRYGYQLVTNTYTELGAGRQNQTKIYAGNVLACRNCHQESGTKQFGIPWVGVTDRYPRYSGRENRVVGLPGRINGCLERSLDGRRLPEESREIKAIVAYMNWLGRDAPAKIKGQGTPPFRYPNRQADLRSGEEVYKVYCQTCHGMDGSGYRSRSEGGNGNYVAPPLWGEGAYNNGAGMHRLLKAGAFARGNMPLGTPWQHPVISTEQAYDVAAFFNSFDRPVKENLEEDYPDLSKKPVDCPYPPYADDFPQEQHQYGPFQPIKEFYRSKQK